MVSFSCSQCGDTIKKKKAEHHLYQCRSAVLSCVDCGREFRDGTYAEHYSCVTEAQKYEKPGTQFEQPKGEKVQMTWFENVQAACRSSKCSPKCQQLLKQLQDFPNTPRRKDKFMNFVGNSIRGFRTEHVEEAWNIIAECSSKNRSQNGESKCNQQGSDNAPGQHEVDQGAKRHDKHSARADTKEIVNATVPQEEEKPCDNVNGVVKKRKRDGREVCTEDIPCHEEFTAGNDDFGDAADKTKKEKKKKRHKICEQVTGNDERNHKREPICAEKQSKGEILSGDEAVTLSKKHRKHKHSHTEPEGCDPPTSSKKKKRHSAEVAESMNGTLPKVENAVPEETNNSHENDSKNKKKKHKKRDRVDSSDGQMLTTNC